MSATFAFLFRLVVVRFYQENAGMFLFLFLLFFGIIPPQFLVQTHFALIKAQVSSPMLAISISLVWLIYIIKCLRFMDHAFNCYRDEFVHLFQSISRSQNIRNLGLCLFMMCSPILVYAGLVLSVAIYGLVYWYIGGLLLSTIIGAFLSIKFALRSLLNPEQLNIRGSALNFLDWGIAGGIISLNFIPLTYLWTEKRLGVIVLKVFSYLSFNLFFIRNAEIFRGDYFTFFIFFIGTTHALLIFNLHKMTELKLAFLRNLPITMLQRVIMVIIAGAILFLPELIMMLISGYHQLSMVDSLVLYGILTSQFVLLFVTLYTSNLDLKKYAQYILLLLLSYLFLYLLLPLSLIIVLNLGLSYVIFHEQYHVYEYNRSK